MGAPEAGECMTILNNSQRSRPPALKAFESLERAYSKHDLQMQYVGVDPTSFARSRAFQISSAESDWCNSFRAGDEIYRSAILVDRFLTNVNIG